MKIYATFNEGYTMASLASLFRQVFATLVVFTLFQTGTSIARAAAVIEDAIEVDALRVSVVFSKYAGRRVVYTGAQADHFHVILGGQSKGVGAQVSNYPFRV
jgi:hypothetical protein